MPRLLTIVVAASALSLVPAALASASAERLKVVASFSIIAGFAKAQTHPLWFKELNGFADHVPETEEYGMTIRADLAACLVPERDFMPAAGATSLTRSRAGTRTRRDVTRFLQMARCNLMASAIACLPMVLRRETAGLKREHGEASADVMAAPATVSGERNPIRHWPSWPGRQDGATTREPGDLPSQGMTGRGVPGGSSNGGPRPPCVPSFRTFEEVMVNAT